MDFKSKDQEVVEPEAAATTAKPTDRGQRVLAQKVWRAIFVFVFAIIGGALGYELGLDLVTGASAPGAESSQFLLVKGYHELVGKGNTAIAVTDKLGFSFIGALLAALLGTAIFNKIVSVGESLKVMHPNEKVAIFFGVAAGLVLTAMISQVTLRLPPAVGVPLTLIVATVLVYLGLVISLSMKDEISFGAVRSGSKSDSQGDDNPELERIKIFDTNVIIDGRVADVCRTGFIEGPIYIPGFVLDEIQHIADSADSLKRARGRRGLDILNQMRSELPLVVRTLDATVDFTGIDEVDSKLVRMAKKLNGAIVTNDFNLNKVAELQGVPVLNINELANALKPVVLPGEEMRVTVIKEGKEQNQGVAYLDDGTMIVIEGGRRRIGETLEVLVSSVLQTVAGKMIFATIKPADDGSYDGDDGPYEPSPRAYTGGRTRRPLR